MPRSTASSPARPSASGATSARRSRRSTSSSPTPACSRAAPTSSRVTSRPPTATPPAPTHAAHEARARGARDVAAKADYEAAATAAHERARAIDDLGNTRDRALAHLAKIAAVIQAVPSKLVRLRALDDEARGTLTGDVGAELERMNVDLRAFEQTLESIVEVHV